MHKKAKQFIALASRELVAAEAHYHRACYSKYTSCSLVYESVSVDKDTDTVMEADQRKII